MKFLSVCSGIEAASVAWTPLGWEAVAFAEIEPFPCAVLKHHYPSVPNWGDMTKFKDWPDATFDVLVGGTPCQSFSVAGLRKGLDDPRGNLALTYLAILDRYRPTWCCWENVPGVLSSNDGRDFGAFVGGLGQLGYGWAYRVLDAQFFGVAQRRRRVFVVGHVGGWQRAAAVLFDGQSLQGHPAPRRETRERITGTVTGGASAGGHGRALSADGAAAGFVVPVHVPEIVPQAMSSKWSKGSSGPAGDEVANLIAHSLRADGFDASEDGTGRGTPLIPIDMRQASRGATITNNRAEGSGGPPGVGVGDDGDPAFTVTDRVQAVALFDERQVTSPDNRSTCRADGAVPTMHEKPFTLAIRGRGDSHDLEYRQDGTANALLTPNVGRAGIGVGAVSSGMAVRRLTPIECARLQGFPDHYLDIIYRGKPAADGNKYKALGNSMAVPVMHWIGKRLQFVHAFTAQERRGQAASLVGDIQRKEAGL